MATRSDCSSSLTAGFCTNSVPHPFAFFPAKGRDTTKAKGRIHTVRDLARWRGVSVFAEVALQLRAFPCLNLQRVVHFRQVERPSTGGTLSRRQARLIELAAGKIRITFAIAEDAIAIAPFALVERPGFFRCRSLKHDWPHWAMVEIAQRKERHLGMMVHGSSMEGFPRGKLATARESENRPAADRSEINPPRWSLPKRGTTGEDLPG